MDPFIAYRILMTIVLVGISLYTFIEGVVFLSITVGRRKTLASAAASSDSRMTRINKRLVRIGQKAIALKALELLSWRTARVLAREIALIVALLVANAFALYHFYTL